MIFSNRLTRYDLNSLPEFFLTGFARSRGQYSPRRLQWNCTLDLWRRFAHSLMLVIATFVGFIFTAGQADVDLGHAPFTFKWWVIAATLSIVSGAVLWLWAAFLAEKPYYIHAMDEFIRSSERAKSLIFVEWKYKGSSSSAAILQFVDLQLSSLYGARKLDEIGPAVQILDPFLNNILTSDFREPIYQS